MPDRPARFNLTARERKDLAKKELIEATVALLLDLSQHRNTAQIAEELGITRGQLHNLYRSDDFIEVYNENFADRGHDPRLPATREGLSDLLPLALQRFRDILEDKKASATAVIKVATKVFDISGMRPITPVANDRRELAEWLKEAGTLQLIQVNEGGTVVMPPAHQEALNRALRGEVYNPEDELGIEPEAEPDEQEAE